MKYLDIATPKETWVKRLNIATGEYMLPSQRAKYNTNVVDPTCQLCQKGEEILSHVLLKCETVDALRKPILKK